MSNEQYKACHKACLAAHQPIEKPDLIDMLIESGECGENERPDLEKDTKLPHGLRVRLCEWLCHGELNQAKSQEQDEKLKRLRAKLNALSGQ
jgi:hypothetical protein